MLYCVHTTRYTVMESCIATYKQSRIPTDVKRRLIDGDAYNREFSVEVSGLQRSATSELLQATKAL